MGQGSLACWPPSPPRPQAQAWSTCQDAWTLSGLQTRLTDHPIMQSPGTWTTSREGCHGGQTPSEWPSQRHRVKLTASPSLCPWPLPSDALFPPAHSSSQASGPPGPVAPQLCPGSCPRAFALAAHPQVSSLPPFVYLCSPPPASLCPYLCFLLLHTTHLMHLFVLLFLSPSDRQDICMDTLYRHSLSACQLFLGR